MKTSLLRTYSNERVKILSVHKGKWRTIVAVRGYPEEVFQTRRNVQTQEPVHVLYPAPSVQIVEGNNNTTTLVIFGIVALVGLLGLFALLGTNNKKCDR